MYSAIMRVYILLNVSKIILQTWYINSARKIEKKKI